MRRIAAGTKNRCEIQTGCAADGPLERLGHVADVLSGLDRDAKIVAEAKCHDVKGIAQRMFRDGPAFGTVHVAAIIGGSGFDPA